MSLTFDSLREQISLFNADSDFSVVEKAWQLACRLHGVKKSDAPEDSVVAHSLEIAGLLAELHMDNMTISSGLLHDVLQTTSCSYDTLTEHCGKDVASIVDGITKISRIAGQSRESQAEAQAENLRKMIVAMAQDIRVILVQLCIQLQTMRTLKHHPKKERESKAQETLDLYAPLANRLGIAKIKWELEDLSLRYLDPEEFREIQLAIARKRKERESYIDEIRSLLKDKLVEAGIEAMVMGRAKHFYSIYQKMRRQKIAIDQIFDLAAVRIITHSVRDCYSALGIIHTLYLPIRGRFKDYVAMPKPNMYQSIHTTVIGPSGHRVEVQIRTEEMHRIAEEGIAAHWKYKEMGRSAVVSAEESFIWLRQVMDWSRELTDPDELADTVKFDLFADEVYVFTPNGDVKALRRGATTIDFAYAVHTEVGKRCRGAKVNGKMVPLKTTLRNGDIIEILTAKNQTPSADWLSFVKTSKAKNKIRQFIKAQERDRSIVSGKEMLVKELRRDRVELGTVFRSDKLEELLEELRFKTVEDMLAALGYGKLRLGTAVNRILERFRPQLEKAESSAVKTTVQRIGGRPGQMVQVVGLTDIVTRIAKCCAPVPGDPIVGVVSRARGVSVHNRHCSNVQGAAQRIVEVEWVSQTHGGHPVKLIISASDRPGLFADIAATISKLKTNIINGEMQQADDYGEAHGSFILEIENLAHMHRVKGALEKLKGVTSVIRAMNPGTSRSKQRY